MLGLTVDGQLRWWSTEVNICNDFAITYTHITGLDAARLFCLIKQNLKLGEVGIHT
jgi:hypothetical protein